MARCDESVFRYSVAGALTGIPMGIASGIGHRLRFVARGEGFKDGAGESRPHGPAIRRAHTK